MKIGDRIRFYRIQQNKTQEDLANGLISVSYLSKIENNLSLPSLEVVDMLCEKLGIRFIDEEEPSLLEELKDWYKLIIYGSKEQVNIQYDKFKEEMKESRDSTALVYFMLFELRFFLQQRMLNEANKALQKLREIADIFTEDLNYYFNKFTGLFEYLNENFEDAYDKYKKAESILVRNVYEKWEEADLYYSLGLASSQLWKVTLSIHYTNQALAIYQVQYDLKRSAECNILLGISYRRTNEYKKAEECYLLADTIANNINNSNIKGFIHHNLGYLYSTNGQHDKAIYHFGKSIEFHEEYNKTFPTIHSIISENYKKGDYENGLKWVQDGLLKLGDSKEYVEYFYHFKTYQYLMTEQTVEFEHFLKEEVIPYFQKHNKNKFIADYSEVLAKYFERSHKYKQSSYYLNLANAALKKINNIN